MSTATDTTATPPPSNCATEIATTNAIPGSVMPGVAENPNYKNRLQEFTQGASIPLPSYETVNVSGPCQPPQFRSSVAVDGETYTSLNIYSNKKAAEQAAAKLALESINKKIKDCISTKTAMSGFPPIFQDKTFCKSILHEFAAKMNMKLPKYETVKVEGPVPVFITSLIFNGEKYDGSPGVNKKEAEQLAARNAILSILVDSEIGLQLCEVVKSKAKLYSIVYEDVYANEVPSVPYVQPNVGVTLETSAVKGGCQGASQTDSGTENVIPKHEFRKHEVDTCSQPIPLPITFVPSLGEQAPLNVSGQKRKNKKKKKANKKAKVETETAAFELPLSQGMS